MDIQRMVESVRWIFGQVQYCFQPGGMPLSPNLVDLLLRPSVITPGQFIAARAQLYVTDPLVVGCHKDGTVPARSRRDGDDAFAR